MFAVMSLQIQMPTAPHPVCLPLSLPATVISLTTGRTSRPSRGAQTHPDSPFSTCPTGRGIPFLSFSRMRVKRCASCWAEKSHFFSFSGKRCAVGSSTRGVSGRWSLILVSSSPAVTRSVQLWHPPRTLRSHKHFLPLFRRTWRRHGEPTKTPSQLSRWGPHSFVSSGRHWYLPFVRWLCMSWVFPLLLYFLWLFCKM